MTTATQPRVVQAILDRAARMAPHPFTTDATQRFGVHTAAELLRAFAGERPVVWTNVLFPYEVLCALDLIGFSYEVMGSTAGSLNLVDMLDAADDAYPSRDTCTFLRASLGGGLARVFPRPAAMLCTSHLCEGAPKVAHALAYEWEVPSLLLDVPDRWTPASEAYVAAQLEQIAEELARVAGHPLEMDRLAAAFAESNRAAAILRDIHELRRRSPVPVFGSPTIGLSLYLPWGHPAGTDIADARLQEIRAQLDSGEPLLPGGEAHRLLWMHLRPYYDTDLFEFLEIERRAVIVYNNGFQVYWDPLVMDDPWRSLARKILRNPDLLPARAAAEYYVRAGRAYRVDGVVQFNHWGCRWNAGRNRIFKDAFAEEDIPFINVDGDGVDCRASSAGQLRTRIEGFLEILEARED